MRKVTAFKQIRSCIVKYVILVHLLSTILFVKYSSWIDQKSLELPDSSVFLESLPNSQDMVKVILLTLREFCSSYIPNHISLSEVIKIKLRTTLEEDICLCDGKIPSCNRPTPVDLLCTPLVRIEPNNWMWYIVQTNNLSRFQENICPQNEN